MGTPIKEALEMLRATQANPNFKTQEEALEQAGQITFLTGLDCSGDEMITKQSLKDDTDINVILAKHGITPDTSPAMLAHMPPDAVFGERSDQDTDLQHTLNTARATALAAWDALRPEIREQFGTFENLMEAVVTGKDKRVDALLPKDETPTRMNEPQPENTSGTRENDTRKGSDNPPIPQSEERAGRRQTDR